MKKLFIVGCPRSGTTLLQQALHRHSQILFPPETSFLFLLGFPRWEQRAHWRRLQRDLGIALPFPSRGIQEAADLRRCYEQIATLYTQKMGRAQVVYFGEKSPEHQLRLELLRELFPQAKVLLIYRDGRDVALSLSRMSWWAPDVELGFALWLHYYRIQKEVSGWRWPGLRLVRYEQLVQEPEQELRQILAFLELPYEPQVLTGTGSRQVLTSREVAWKARSLEQISAARVGLWRRELSAAQLALLERWGGWALQELGYPLHTANPLPPPWWFYPKLFLKMAAWLLRQRRYRVLKEAYRQGLSILTHPRRKITGSADNSGGLATPKTLAEQEGPPPSPA
jgi:hypothetical protein